MKMLLQIIRFFTGAVFIVSGLVKANDPLGLSYKMQEFFEAWGLTAFHDYTLAVALAMNLFEVVAGIAIIVGWRFKVVSWMVLLLTLFFTFLTAYAMFSGKIATCGCFGDCLPLQPAQSFAKDILLNIFMVVLIYNHRHIKPLCSSKANISILILSAVLVMAAQWYVLRHLPFVDCLPYKKGNNIIEQMKLPEGAVADSFAIKFRYKKAGEIVEFGADEFPDDFDEPLYEYVDRFDKLVRKGNAVAPIPDFNLKALDGADVTDEVLNTPGYYVVVFCRNFTRTNDWLPLFKNIENVASERNIPVYIVTPNASAAKTQGFNNILIADATAIKTAARTDPAFFLMNGPIVREKKSYLDAKAFMQSIEKIK